MDNIDLVSVFFIALSAAFSHCIGMCGGIVVAYSQCKLPQSRYFMSFLCHVLYSFGRITTYAIIGAITATIGSSIALNQSAQGGVFIIVGFIMCCFGLCMLFLPRFLRFLEPNIANIGIFKHAFLFVLGRKNLYSFYVLGLLNGLFPCGVVYFFALSASVAGSALGGAITMFVFGVATMIPLLLLGIFNSILQLARYKAVISKITFVAIILFGAWTIYKGFYILFH